MVVEGMMAACVLKHMKQQCVTTESRWQVVVINVQTMFPVCSCLNYIHQSLCVSNLCVHVLKLFLYRLSVTELLYQVFFKGTVRNNGQEVAPSFSASDIETAVSSVVFYNIGLQSPLRADYLFSLTLDGIPARTLVQQQLNIAWSSINSKLIMKSSVSF